MRSLKQVVLGLVCSLGVSFADRTMLRAAELECSLHLPTYGAEGNRFAMAIVAASISGKTDADPFGTQSDPRLTFSGETIRFPKEMLGYRLRVMFRVPGLNRNIHYVTLGACRQRSSITIGQKDSGADVEATSIRGRIIGCKIGGDWWIRGMPMFGDVLGLPDESYVDPSTGEFSISSSFSGHRHIFVIGKDKHPIRTFVFNVTVGGIGEVNNVGTLNLAGSCPK